MASLGNRMKVVVVDDSAAMRAVLRAILKSDGHEVVGEASNGMSAVTMVSHLKPDIVTLDLVMPGLSGLETLSEILRTGSDTHVLIVSATNDRATIKQAFDLGAIGYVTKPFNSDRILRVFDQLSGSNKPSPAIPSTTGSLHLPKKRCVLVDDNRSIRTLLRSILGGAGISVVAEAGDGMDGLEAIERELPDFVCLDVDMPKVDGLNTLRCLRAVHPDLPVIMVTSHNDRDTVSRLIEHRVSGYLVKPFEPDQVLAAVRKLVALR